MKKNRLSKKILSLVLSVAILFGNIPTTAFATEGNIPPNESTVLECHTQHDETCGYVASAEGTEGEACAHTCNVCNPVTEDKKDEPDTEDKKDEPVTDKTVTDSETNATPNGESVVKAAMPRAGG